MNWTAQSFTNFSLADIFNRTLSRFLWEAFNHAANNARKRRVQKYSPLPVSILSQPEQRKINELGQASSRHHKIRIRVISFENVVEAAGENKIGSKINIDSVKKREQRYVHTCVNSDARKRACVIGCVRALTSGTCNGGVPRRPASAGSQYV